MKPAFSDGFPMGFSHGFPDVLMVQSPGRSGRASGSHGGGAGHGEVSRDRSVFWGKWLELINGYQFLMVINGRLSIFNGDEWENPTVSCGIMW